MYFCPLAFLKMAVDIMDRHLFLILMMHAFVKFLVDHQCWTETFLTVLSNWLRGKCALYFFILIWLSHSWWQHAANLASYEQQDAHEFFISMLDGIHEKVDKDRRRPQSQGKFYRHCIKPVSSSLHFLQALAGICWCWGQIWSVVNIFSWVSGSSRLVFLYNHVNELLNWCRIMLVGYYLSGISQA